jgi:myo-inositol-1(or 4)-monophosphatase
VSTVQPRITPEETRALLDVAVRTARGAADLVLARRRSGVDVVGTKSSLVDVVTEVDTASERYIREALRQARPQDAVLGEEDGFQPGSSGLTWVVDPVDGTVNLLYGIPSYAVSIAVVTGDPTVPGRWAPVAGCVSAPGLRRTYWAGAGLGAWRSEDDGDQAARPIAVRPAVPLAVSLVGTGFGYGVERRAAQGRVVAALLPRVRDIRRAGCASLDLCAVASGELDGYFERGLNPWDLAAGALVVTEAGGLVTGLRGGPAGEAMTLAGPATTVAALDAFLTDLRADDDV